MAIAPVTAARIRGFAALTLGALASGAQGGDIFLNRQWNLNPFPQDVKLADMNGDTFLDMVSSNNRSDTVSISFSDGADGFLTPIEYPAGDGPYKLAVADLDGDADLDVAVTDFQTAGTVAVLLNNGAGVLGAPAILTAGNRASAIAAGDLTGDARPDIVCTNENTDNIHVFINDGSGGFGAGTPYAVGDVPRSVVIANLDADADNDVVVGNYSTATTLLGSVSALLNTGGGALAPAVTYSTSHPISMVAGEFDGDPQVEILFTRYTNGSGYGLGMMSSVGDGTLTYQALDSVGGQLGAIAAGNFDGDLDLDLAIILNSNNFMQVLSNNGAATFSGGPLLATGLGSSGIAAGDIEGDGDIDIAISQSSDDAATVLRNNGSAVFKTEFNDAYTLEAIPVAVTTGDLDNDGDVDVISSCESSGSRTYIHLNNGFGTLTLQPLLPMGNGPKDVALGHFNNDPWLDIVVPNQGADRIAIRLTTAAVTFAPSVNITVGDGPSVLGIGDFNGDTFDDIAVCNALADTVSILLNNGAGVFAVSSTLAVGDDPEAITVGNVDGDADVDLVVANKGGDTVSVLKNHGAGTFAAQVVYPCGDVPMDIALGRLDSDSDLDIAVSCMGTLVGSFYENCGVVVLSNNGAGVFSAPVLHDGGEGPRALALAKLDSNTTLDIVVANERGSNVQVLRGNGDGTFQTREDYCASMSAALVPSPKTLSCGDLNGDGAIDLVTLCNTPAWNIVISLNQGAAPPAECIGDVNGDGFTNVSDFNIIALNFGSSVPPGTNGDITGDGVVDVSDFNIMAGAFGCGSS